MSDNISIQQLEKWFDKKGLVNVVLRSEDVADLQPYMQSALAEFMDRLGCYIHISYNYMVLPIKALTEKCNIAELGLLQEIVACYREVRRGKGYPMMDKNCDCGGKDSDCRICDGQGATRTLTEMSEEEAGLAYEREEAAQKA
jgi:hypothetical protein